ncbi:MAG: hypothetical protein ACFFCO_07740 [Promethearchaeota archaeon]
MWLSDLLQEYVPLLCFAIAIRRPVLLVGFLEASALRRLASLPSHRNLIEITPDWFDSEEKLAELNLLFQSETANITAPRLSLVAPNLPTKLLPSFYDLPKAWVASTLRQPTPLPENVVIFNLRTKTLINADEDQLASNYLLSLLNGVVPQEWELVLQTGLRLIAAKAQSLVYLIEHNVRVKDVLHLLGINIESELDLCVAITKADYHLDLDTFKSEAKNELDTRGQLDGGDSHRLRQDFERRSRSMIHIDDVRTMLAGITDTLAARGIPPDLLIRVVGGALREWIPDSRS